MSSGRQLLELRGRSRSASWPLGAAAVTPSGPVSWTDGGTSDTAKAFQ